MIRKKTVLRTLIAVSAMGIMLLTGCNAIGEKEYSKTDFVMDTVLQMTIIGKTDETSKVKQLLDRLEKEELSWREKDSTAAKINQICRQGHSFEMEDEFAQWTKTTIELAQKSNGAFDPTIGELTRLWNIEGEHPKVPEKKAIDRCRKEIGYKNINIEERRISIKNNATLDLGAVGKGIACDIVKKELKKDPNVSGAVVAVGGSILTYGKKQDGTDWNIAVQDPQGKDGEAMGVISLEGTHYISTSGDYEKYFVQDGKKYHHILDPSTGYPAESGLTSVTIICDNGLLSDGLSTACFVLGAEKGIKLAKEYGAEAILITKAGEVLTTDSIKEHFKILNEQYQFK